ncbi:MAG: hypothetical protein ACI9VM_000311 [Candidatus Azotimanducaceae bacterium]|jgi:hypothetical protein
MPKLPTIFFFIAGFTLVVIHLVSLELSLYWKYAWFDIPMHILGGSVIALSLFAIHEAFPRFPARFLYPIPVLSIVLVTALAWEVFELKAGIPIEIDFEFDTSVDLIMGLLGGIIGYIVGHSVSSFDVITDSLFDPNDESSFTTEKDIL